MVLVVLWTSIGVWSVATIGWIGLLTVERVLMGPVGCNYQGESSFYGEATWSWVPPGEVCTYELSIDGQRVEVVEDPPPSRIGIAAVLVLWGASNLAFAVAILPRERVVAEVPARAGG